MNTETIRYPSHDGIHTIHAELYTPAETEKAPRGVIQIVHGVAEHIGRYRSFVQFLTARGFVVCGENHLGHGPETKPEDRGFFAEQDGWMTVAKDTAALSDLVKARFPGLPFVMFGHSMGSFITRTVYLAGLASLDGVILCGTGNKSKLVIGLAQRICKGEIRKHGAKAESAKMEKLAFGSYNRRVKHPRSKNDWISSMPAEVDRYNMDPDCGFPVKLGMYLSLFEGIGYIIDPKHIAQADKNVPVLFIAGDADPVGAYGKGVRAAFRAMQKAGIRDLSLKLYPGRHEILNDVAKEQVQADVLAWLDAHLAAAARD